MTKPNGARAGRAFDYRRGMSFLFAAFLAICPTLSAHADDDDRDGRGESRAYAIGLWGDLPYSDVQAQVGVPNLIADMNAQKLAFVVHDGDLKAGNGTPGSVTPTVCSDAALPAGAWIFQRAEHCRDGHARRQ
jgi:hypothetical protein